MRGDRQRLPGGATLNGGSPRAAEARPAGQAFGALANGLAIAYVAGGQAVGLWLLSGASAWAVGIGVLAIAHSLVIAAYLIHEAAHGTVFRRPVHNRALGELLSFIAGSAYASFERIRRLHLRHHR